MTYIKCPYVFHLECDQEEIPERENCKHYGKGCDPDKIIGNYKIKYDGVRIVE